MTIEGMPDLEKWLTDETSQIIPYIKQLTIRNCRKLTQMPHLPSVKTLELTRCNEMLLMSLTTYSAVTTLWIGGFPEITSFPEVLLTNITLLEVLFIHDCPELKSVSKDVCDLPAIKILWLDNCGQVESLMEGACNLTSLKLFYISCCNHLKSLPDEGLRGLTS